MRITLKNFSYVALTGWTVLALLEIWNLTKLPFEVPATFGVLTVAAILTLWVKERA